MILILDNFDSFTFNLVDYFNQLGIGTEVIRNDASMEEVTSKPFSGVVLSPGPENPSKAGNLMGVIEYYESKLPILGICLGHQAIGQFYGATLTKAIRPMHGKISQIRHGEDGLFGQIPNPAKVVRYHSLILKDLPDCLIPTAFTVQNELMGFRHESLPIAGFQFHPEAVLTEQGIQMLSNWIRFNNIAE